MPQPDPTTSRGFPALPRPDRPQIVSEEVAEKFSNKMHEIGLKEKEREAVAAAAQQNVPYINLVGFPISPETISTIPESESGRLKAICFFAGATGLRIGAVDPKHPELPALLRLLEERHHARLTLYLISPHSFEFAFRLYGAVPKIRKFTSGVEVTEADIKRFEQEINVFRDLNEKLREVSISDVVSLTLAAAIKARASDIHIEAEERGVKIRFRIDGILHDAANLDQKLWQQIISRIKLVARLKINIDDRPQDGRFTIFLTKEKIDVRVSTLPTAYGESVVMRILMSSVVGLHFENLGLRGRAFEALKAEIAKPNGMVVTTGPTGSGKTTTLYAILNQLNNPGTKIITIEDPIEYKLEGINQSQVEPGKGYSFASGLKNILRQDPDIVMVGEVRDLETAEIAINAALTGHLVLTTLHTNDAAGTIPRLLSMQVKTFLLAPAINAMIGQRLVRKICQSCKKEDKLDGKTLARVMHIVDQIPRDSGYHLEPGKLKGVAFYRGEGCDVCQGLGYRDQVGIFEVMTMNREVETLILNGHVSEYDMRSIGAKQGMITMLQDGLLKAIDGITSVDEVFRVAKDITERE